MGRRPDLSLAVQALALRRIFPDGEVILRPAHLQWQTQVQPSPVTQRYLLRLTAHLGRNPTVHVVHPLLQPNEAGLLPHVYDTGALCLSEFGDWKPTMLFADTIVPWAMEWLVFYELWRASGTWYGDGPDHLDPVSQSLSLHPYQ